jgi:dTDP-4-amino-4,6-dideoxygalactose transaminase
MKITGLDKTMRELNDARKAFGALDGELGAVSFNPDDPMSIEAAIQEMEEMIDARVGHYAGNAIVSPMIEQMKEQYRTAIIEKAAEARLEAEGGE